MTLAELSLKRPVSAVMMFVSLTVIGLISAFRLPLEFFPDLQVPFMLVEVPYPGSTPTEIERVLARPIEEALATLSGIEQMNSTSRADGLQIFLQFKWGQDVSIKAMEAREKIDAIRADLPTDLQRYQVLKFSSSDQPVLGIRISSNRDLSNSYELLDRKIKRPLERLAGVARVDIAGVAPSEVQIELSADRLVAAGIALNDLFQRLSQANFSTSAGRIRDGQMRYRVQPVGEWRSIEEIRNLLINDKGLRLGDIASVTLKPARLDYERHLDLRPAIAVDVLKERNANLVDVGRAVLQELDRISHEPEMEGIQLYFVEDQAKGVTDSLRELGNAGLIGTLLSVLVLFYFLRDWSSTLMVSLAIPICFVITLGGMYFFGITLNVLSMMGLLLAVGMLVDNAVVVVESIYQYREKYPGRPWYSAIQGTRVVGVAISAGTFTSIVVFLPNIFGEKNQISIFLTQVAVSMAIAHLASWLVAVSLIPMLAAKLPPPKFIGRENTITKLQRAYTRLISWTLKHRGKTVLVTLSLLGLSYFPIVGTKMDMFPSGETRTLTLQYSLNGEYRLEELRKSIGVIEQYLTAHKKELDIRSVYSYFDERGSAMTRLLLTEGKDIQRPANDVMEDVSKKLPKIPIGSVGFDRQQRGGGEGLQMSLIGDSMQQLHELANGLIPVLEKVKGLRDIRTAETTGDQEMVIQVDRERAQSYGFSASQVAQYVAIALRGSPLKEFRGGDTQIPVWLRFQNADTQNIDNLKDYKLKRNDGTSIPLLSVANMRTQSVATAVSRENRQTALQISANVRDGTTLGEARKGIEQAMNSVALPAGYRWAFGRGFSDSDEAGAQMLFNMLIALVMVYVVMASMFESLIFPAAIMTTFLFSIFGVFWLFWLTGTTFSIMAWIGVLILMGVVVNNGIVMIVHINQLRHAGMARFDALVQGARDRLRPILMTMGTAILGMIPLCVSSIQIGGNGPPYYPMARAIAGGLVFSTLLTLIVLPMVYSLLDDMRMWVRNVLRDARTGSWRPSGSVAASISE